jgi:hypothetical protein
LLAAHPELRAGIDRPIFEAEQPAIVFCRHDRAMVEVLLEFGADANARDIDHKSTAAQYKVRDTELCRHLIARSADVDIFMASALGDRALVERVLNADPGCLTARIGQAGYAPVPPGHI